MGPIFIAEDDPLMERMYERAFRFNGYEVVMAPDGEQALATLLSMNPKPKAIVLDIMMPKLSGFDVLKKLKEDTNLRSVPVVMLSNLAGQEDAQKAKEMGAAHYLVKSQYNPKQVVEIIRSVMTE